MALVKKCRHARKEWRRCRCAWYAYLDGRWENLGADALAAGRQERARRAAATGGSEFEAVAARWLAVVEPNVRDTTAENYRAAVAHAVARIGHWPVQAITAAAILEAEALMAKRGLGTGSRKNVRRAVLAVLRYARDLGLIDTIPDLRGRYVLKDPERAAHLEPAVMRSVLDHAAEDLRPCLTFGWLTGLRPGELLAVEYGDVKGRKLEVRRQIVTRGNRPGPLKTDASRRDVDLTAAALACIGDGEGRVWPVLYDLLSRRWRDALKAAGVPSCGLHTLRHSNASMRLASGQDIGYVANQLGHATPNVTLRIYAHLVPNPERDIDALDAFAGI